MFKGQNSEWKVSGTCVHLDVQQKYILNANVPLEKKRFGFCRMA